MAKFCPVLNEYVVYLACQDCDRECQKSPNGVREKETGPTEEKVSERRIGEDSV